MSNENKRINAAKMFSSPILKEEKVNNFLTAGYKTITEFFYCFLSSLFSISQDKIFEQEWVTN